MTHQEILKEMGIKFTQKTQADFDEEQFRKEYPREDKYNSCGGLSHCCEAPFGPGGLCSECGEH